MFIGFYIVGVARSVASFGIDTGKPYTNYEQNCGLINYA
jgi:hypothetical protein